jgi:hypothetical protein
VRSWDLSSYRLGDEHPSFVIIADPMPTGGVHLSGGVIRHKEREKEVVRFGRRSSTIPSDRRTLASALGEYRGLQLPGPVWADARWHPRLEVLVTPGELWVSGNGETRCYPVADMVLASFSTNPQGALRVDFLSGGPLCVKLDDNGKVLETLRQEIWEYEKSFLVSGLDDDGLDVAPDLLDDADARLRIAVSQDGGQRGRIERRELMRRSAELRRMARVDALRGRRQRMLGLSDGPRASGTTDVVRPSD